MGLDGVEWLMEVERSFGLTISDEEAHGLRTLGDALALLERRLGHRRGFCASQRVYHLVSRARGRRRLPLDAPIGEAPLELDGLEVPRRAPTWAKALAATAVLTGVVGLNHGLVGGLVGVAAAGAVLDCSRSLNATLSVRDAVEAITNANSAALLARGAGWSRPRARAVLFGLSAEQSGLAEGEFDEQTRLMDLFPHG